MNRIKNYFNQFLLGIFLLGFYCATYAQNVAPNFVNNPEVSRFISDMHTRHGFSTTYLQHIFAQARYQPEVIEKMTRPHEKKLSWVEYRKLFMTPETLNDGVAFWKKNALLLTQAEQTYGVPASLIVAILGVETLYGKHLGNFRAIDSLATLAFYYPPREKYFRKELENLLIFTRDAHFNPLSIYGSYAGALGYCQFMPSSYIHYAVDTDNRDNPDLFKNPEDAILSIGNFLSKNGWDPNEPVASPAKVFGLGYFKALKHDTKKVEKPQYTLNQLRKYGVKLITPYETNMLANFMTFPTSSPPKYWLGFHNFYVITRYNNSDLYAMVVYQLSKELSARKQQQS